MTTNTYKTASKNVWKKPLAALLSLSILAGMSNICLAEEKHEQLQAKKTTKLFTKEDVDSYGWFIASAEAARLGIDDQKELALSYSKEDLGLIRKLTNFFDTEEKRNQMAKIHNKQKANEALTEEESLIFENYNEALAELKKMLKQKTETSSADVNAEEHLSLSSDHSAKLLKAVDNIKMEEMTTEEFGRFKHNLRLYHSLDQYTRAVLTVVSSWNGKFDLTPEEEKVIKEADAFYSNEENQKLIRSSLESSVELSEEAAEVNKEARKHMIALAQIKDKSKSKNN